MVPYRTSRMADKSRDFPCKCGVVLNAVPPHELDSFNTKWRCCACRKDTVECAGCGHVNTIYWCENHGSAPGYPKTNSSC